MARIQIADLEHENFIELTAEQQYLIQGGLWWVAAAVLIRAATPIAVAAIRWGAAAYIAHELTSTNKKEVSQPGVK